MIQTNAMQHTACPDDKPSPTPRIARREFLGRLAAASAALSLGTTLGGAEPGRRWPLIVFSKAFQELSYEDTAELVAEAGFDGIECPVRKGGQVLPERVDQDLPRMVEALRKRGLALHVATTDVKNVTDPATEKVLRALSKAGIRHYRLGSFRYRKDRPIPDQLQEVRAALRDVAALNRELGLCAGFQNHSGTDTMGAPVWDIYEVIRELDPRHLGIHFDIGHATVEGGYAWSTHARLMEPFLSSVYVKDFTWQKGANGWRAQWCPIGQGMIQRTFFNWLKSTHFNGPVSVHFEYEFGRGDERLQAMRKDVATLRSWVA